MKVVDIHKFLVGNVPPITMANASSLLSGFQPKASRKLGHEQQPRSAGSLVKSLAQQFVIGSDPFQIKPL